MHKNNLAHEDLIPADRGHDGHICRRRTSQPVLLSQFGLDAGIERIFRIELNDWYLKGTKHALTKSQ